MPNIWCNWSPLKCQDNKLACNPAIEFPKFSQFVFYKMHSRSIPSLNDIDQTRATLDNSLLNGLAQGQNAEHLKEGQWEPHILDNDFREIFVRGPSLFL